MSIDHTVVLLPALGETGAQTAELRAAMSEVAHVLTPDIGVPGSTPVMCDCIADPGGAVKNATLAPTIDPPGR